MVSKKLGFEDFILTVNNEVIDFVNQLHDFLGESGCKIEVKEAKSGHVVSYILNKKTVLNYVFRKSGLIVRIYANHIIQYMEFLDTIPDGMVKAISGAPDCKRLMNPEACNAKCAMGYDFMMKGKRFQKCRYSAFMFLVCDENNPFIKTFLTKEIAAT